MNSQYYDVQWQKLENARRNLFTSLDKLSEKTLNTQPAEAEWSQIQVLFHLLYTEELARQYISKKLNNPLSITSPGLKNRIKLGMLTLALRSPIKFKAPAIVSTLPPYASWSETKERWEKNRQDLSFLLSDISDEMGLKAIFKHPIAGYLNLPQMLDFFYEHWQHHEKQIERIQQKTGGNV